MPNPQPILGTNLASAIVPFTDADQFPTHHAQYGKGGWRSVASLSDRDSIPQPRLEDGMVVYVNDIQTAYVYINGGWQELVTGGSGGTQTFTRLYFSKLIDSLPPESSVSFDLPFGKTSMILVLTVSRPVKVTVWSTPDHTDSNPYTFMATQDHLTDDGSALLSDGTTLKQRNYSIFANLESPPQEKVYAVVDSVDDVDGPVTLTITYIVIESGQGQGGGGSSGIDIQLNDAPYDSNISTLDFSGNNWSLQNSGNGLPQGTVSVAVSTPPPPPAHYVVPMNFTYGPDSDEILLFHTFVENVSFDDNFAGSAGNVEISPTQTFTMGVYKNGNSIGTITVNTDRSFVFTTFETALFSIGDTMKIVAPSQTDATVANLSVSLLGIRN